MLIVCVQDLKLRPCEHFYRQSDIYLLSHKNVMQFTFIEKKLKKYILLETRT